MNSFRKNISNLNIYHPSQSFNKAILAFQNQLDDFTKMKYFPNKFLYKIINSNHFKSLSNNQKLSIFHSLYSKGLYPNLISRIFGASSSYSGIPTSLSNRQKYYNRILKTPSLKHRSQVYKNSASKAKNLLLDKAFANYVKKVSPLHKKIISLYNKIRTFEQNTIKKLNRRNLSNNFNLNSLKNNYVNQKFRFYYLLETYSGKINTITSNLLNSFKTFDSFNNTSFSNNLYNRLYNNEMTYDHLFNPYIWNAYRFFTYHIGFNNFINFVSYNNDFVQRFPNEIYNVNNNNLDDLFRREFDFLVAHNVQPL